MDKKTKRVLLGFLAGMIMGNFIAFMSGFPNIVTVALVERVGSPATAVILQTVLGGFIGIAGFTGIGFYEIEHWSLLKALALHYLVIMAVFLPVGFLLCWLPNWQSVLVMAVIMAVAQSFIFVIMYAIYRSQINTLNTLQSYYLSEEQNADQEK